MIDLEAALVDLGEHLDYPVGDQLAVTLRRRLDARVLLVDGRRHRAHVLLAVAASFIALAMAVVAIGPARRAVADWLGIGAVEIRRSNVPPSTNPATGHVVPGTPGSRRDADALAQLASAQKAVAFTIATPRDASAGTLVSVAVDHRVPGGLVALTYERFTLVEIASPIGRPPALGKVIGPVTRVDDVTVNGVPGLWIDGAHEIGYFDRLGNFKIDTVRRSGPVLLWARAAVTYRIEGFRTLADAQNIAASIG